jgi:DNA phosphorothioation-dependent restriction protein DptG
MRLHLNRENLNKEFKVKDDLDQKIRLTHTSGPRGKKILPYTASINIIQDYRALLGNFSRGISYTKFRSFDKEIFFNTIREKVESDDTDKFLTIISELFFDEQGELVLSHPFFFNYLDEGQNNEKKVATFLKEVLVSEEIINKVVALYNKRPENVLLSILYASLPTLDKETSSDEKEKEYVCLLPEIKEVFKKDLLFLLENDELLIRHFKELLLYYYFFYSTQLILELDRMFAEKNTSIYPVYFNVSWEARSKTRDSYKNGWKKVSSKLSKLFAHVNCFAMLNHIENDNYKVITYDRYKELVNSVSHDQQDKIAEEIQQLNSDYQAYLGDVEWSKMKNTYISEGQPALKNVKELFNSISFQFQKNVSSRSRAAERFYEGYSEFAKKYFLKQSGSLGYTFNLTQDQIIFLTKLCIQKKNKIPLKELFIEMENRGVFLDRDSKKCVIKLYERLNILEKKSDSGDAQYVKYIL